MGPGPHGHHSEQGRHHGPGPNIAYGPGQNSPGYGPGERGGRMREGRGRPEGPPRFGGFRDPRFGHGPHVGRGDVRLAVLALLAAGPRHGYQIIQEISERSSGMWRASPGSVYPALQLLEDEGLIRAEQVDNRRVFNLTESGQAYVAERREQLAAVWKTVSGTVDDGMVELRDLYEQVGIAVRQVGRAGSKSEVAAARQLLVTTRRQLYRILADAEPAASGERSSDAAPVS